MNSQPEITNTIRQNKDRVVEFDKKFRASTAGTVVAWMYYAAVVGLAFWWAAVSGEHKTSKAVQMFGAALVLGIVPAALRIVVALTKSEGRKLAIQKNGSEIRLLLHSVWLAAAGIGYCIDPLFGSSVFRVLAAGGALFGIFGIVFIVCVWKKERDQRQAEKNRTELEARVARAMTFFGFVQEIDETDAAFARRCYKAMAEKCAS